MGEQHEFDVYEFGPFRVERVERRLLRDGVPVPLTAKAFDTLIVLLNDVAVMVSKSHLMDAVWPETAVEENNLTQQISALRKAFGERAGDHRYIVTVPGRGYCFVAPVTHFKQDACAAEPLAQSDRSARAVFSSSSLIGYGLAAVYVLLVCVPSFYLSLRDPSRATVQRSVAILRFRSADVGDDLLGMGIRDTLRAKLGSLDDISVRPTDTDISGFDVVDAGEKLDVDVVLTGSVQHDDGRVRVNVEMVDVSNKRIVWGNTFDETFANMFELQDSIAAAVLIALHRERSASTDRPANLLLSPLRPYRLAA